jgi:hypothetical protein
VATAPTPASPVVAAQARLILQDPNAASEAKLPALRLSRELLPSPTSAMDRATAQQVWQALQLTPDELITQRLQLLDAYTKQDSATANARAARAEAAKLKTKLKELQDTRWQHPAVYGAGAAFLGLTGLWLWERKKRVVAQRGTALWVAPGALPEAAHMPVIEAAPEVVPVDAVVDHSSVPSSAPIFDPIATSITQEDLLSYVAPLEPSHPSFARPEPWWKRWGRKSNTAAPTLVKPETSALKTPAHWSTPAPVLALAASALPAPVLVPALAAMPAREAAPAVAPLARMHVAMPTPEAAVSISFDDSQDDELGMEAPTEEFYASDTGGLQSYNPMRSKLSDVEEGMEQLLEIRMAVQAMVDLEQLPAAKKLLDNHIEDVPHTSAWAYLVHLDLSSQMGQRDAFEEMRKRYRLEFNRLAPYWKEADAAVQTLDTYTRPMAELSALWHRPQQARTLIATWLLGAQYARRQFQLPAYNDLLDLYDLLEGMSDTLAKPSTSPQQGEDFMSSTHVYLDLPLQSAGAGHSL